MNAEPPDDTRAAGGSAFPTTHWSVVLHAGAGSESQARAALQSLCSRYWYPLYSFARRQGRSHHEAEDCTQEFLAHLLANAGVASARPERGRFRAFLLSALRNFLTNEWHRTQTAKRGGGQTLLSLDLRKADDRFAHEPTDPGITPEQAFDRTWAFDMIDRAIGDLRADYENSGRATTFKALRPHLWENSSPMPQAEQAARSGMSVHVFKVALHRLRQRFGERLRALVAETVADDAELAAEVRHLISAISTRSSRG